MIKKRNLSRDDIRATSDLEDDSSGESTEEELDYNDGSDGGVGDLFAPENESE